MQVNDLMRPPRTYSMFNPEILLEFQEPEEPADPVKAGRRAARATQLAEAVGIDKRRLLRFRLDQPQTVQAWLLHFKMAQKRRRKAA